jgi:hypothetical protein
MVTSRSSRITTMKYKYKIEKNSITEFENDLMGGNWNFEFLKKNNTCWHISEYEIQQCFLRTKEWCLENHIELLL